MIQEILPETILQYLPSIHAITSIDARTKKVAIAFFASLCFAIGVLALTVKPIPLYLIALPAFVSAGVLLWLITKVRSYSDSEALKEFKKEASNRTLDSVLREHTLEALMRFEIISFAQFPQKFRESMKNKTWSQVVTFHKEATEAAAETGAKVEIPPLHEFKEKWQASVKGCAPISIFAKNDMEFLVEHHILTNAQKGQYIAYKTAKQTYTRAFDTSQKTYTDGKEAPIKAFTEYVDGLTNPSLQVKYRADLAYLSKAGPREWKAEDLNVFQNLPDANSDPDTVARRAFSNSMKGLQDRFIAITEPALEAFGTAVTTVKQNWPKEK